LSTSIHSKSESAPEINIESVWTITSVVIASAIALLALYLAPVLVGEYITQLGVSETRAGLILSIELAGFTIGSAAMFMLLSVSWRKILFFAIILMIISNLVLLQVNSLTSFIICRFVAGLGAGLIMTLTIQVIGLMRNPDRVYGIWTVGQLSLGALGMIVFPIVVAAGGIEAVFVIWTILAAILFFFIRLFPNERNPAHNPHAQNLDTETESAAQLRPGLLALLGLLIYYAGMAGVWVYIERVGNSWGIAPDVIANILFISLLIAIIGAVVAIMIDDKFGRAKPISISLAISALAMMMLMRSNGPMVFLIAACLFNFGWYLFLPYISAVIAATDNNGNLLTGLAVTFPAALAGGPAIAAMLIGSTESLLPVLIYGTVSVPLGLALILPATGAFNDFTKEML